MEKVIGMLGFALMTFFFMVGFFFGNVWLIGSFIGLILVCVSLYCLEN